MRRIAFKFLSHPQKWLSTVLREIAAGEGYGIGYTCYPDDFTKERLRNEYPQFHEQMYGSLSGSC